MHDVFGIERDRRQVGRDRDVRTRVSKIAGDARQFRRQCRVEVRHEHVTAFGQQLTRDLATQVAVSSDQDVTHDAGDPRLV